MIVRPFDQCVKVLIIGTHFGMGPVYDRGKSISDANDHGPCGIACDSPKTNVFATRG
jgi:hypothetical protein